MNRLAEVRKAIAATVTALVAIAAAAGTNIDPAISTAVVSLLGALAVYLIPNETDPELDRERIGL